MSAEVKEFIEDPSKPKNPLAVLWWRYINKAGITPERWNHLMNRYLRSKLSNTRTAPKDISQTRSNENRRIFNKYGIMSWNKFIKAVLISGPKKVTIILKTEENDGSNIEVEMSIDNEFYAILKEMNYFEDFKYSKTKIPILEEDDDIEDSGDFENDYGNDYNGD